MTIQALNTIAAQAARPNASGVIRKMEGIMWYTMLSEMNKTGLDSSTLGAGSDAYQSLFLWNMAENDFGRYDGGLVSATLNQIGGRASPPPALAPSELSPVASSFTADMPADVGVVGGVSSGAVGSVTDAVVLAHAADLTRSIWPALRTAASVLGVPPIGLLAQAALETGWGSAISGNNLFGIKARGAEPSSPHATHEMVDGTLLSVTANFRDYGSPQACVMDYIRLIQSNFQNVVGQSSVTGFAHALQSGGFATDSNYASKIIMISQSPMMQQMLGAVGADDALSD